MALSKSEKENIVTDVKEVASNASVLLEEIKKLKPASAKGIFIGSIALSSTMGPGIKVNSADLL